MLTGATGAEGDTGTEGDLSLVSLGSERRNPGALQWRKLWSIQSMANSLATNRTDWIHARPGDKPPQDCAKGKSPC